MTPEEAVKTLKRVVELGDRGSNVLTYEILEAIRNVLDERRDAYASGVRDQREFQVALIEEECGGLRSELAQAREEKQGYIDRVSLILEKLAIMEGERNTLRKTLREKLASLSQARAENERLKARTLPEREQSGLPHQPMMCEGQRFCASCRYPDQGAPNYTLVPWPCKAHLRDLCGRLVERLTTIRDHVHGSSMGQPVEWGYVIDEANAALAEAREKGVGK